MATIQKQDNNIEIFINKLLSDNLDINIDIEEFQKFDFSTTVIDKIKDIFFQDNPRYIINSHRYNRIRYLMLKTFLQQKLYVPESKDVEYLIRCVEEVNYVEAFIHIYLENYQDELFGILEEEFLSEKLPANFYQRLIIYLLSVVNSTTVNNSQYFNLQTTGLTKVQKEIIQDLEKNDIFSVFEKLDEYGLSGILVNGYKMEYLNGIEEKESIKWLNDFTQDLLKYFRSNDIGNQTTKLIKQLQDYIDAQAIGQYFEKLINLGLNDINTKFSSLKKDFIRGYIDDSFYQELRYYAIEAVNTLFRQKVKEIQLANPILIEKFENKNAGSWDMFGDFTYEFQPQINLLLGRNGYGKTHLLRFIIAILQNDAKTKKMYASSYFVGINLGEEKYSLTRKQFWMFDKIPVLGITDARFLDKSDEVLQYQAVEKISLETDGGYFLLNQKPMQGLINNLFVSLASQHSENKKAPIFELMAKVISELTEAKEKFEFVEIKNRSNSFIGAAYQILVRTEASPKPLPLQKVSQGTMSVLVIVGLIYDFLRVLYEKEDCTQEAGIVFIDEIDAHLHPFWQRKIIGILRDIFPKVQFFLTAHSPLLVAGCEYGEVSVMQKDKQQGNFVVKTFAKHFLGAEIDDLYHEVFGLGDLRDENYQHYLKEIPNVEALRVEVEKLSQKKSLNDQEKQKINDLYYTWQVMLNEEKNKKIVSQEIDAAKLKAELDILRMENEYLKQKMAEKNGN
jgi:energy-coupling factor transporter ATP-binding protein EcfA2